MIRFLWVAMILIAIVIVLVREYRLASRGE